MQRKRYSESKFGMPIAAPQALLLLGSTMTTSSPTHSINRTAEEVSSFINGVQRVYMLDRPAKREDDRRADERYHLTMPLLITHLDDQLQPLSYQHHAVTRDISVKGVGLVTTSPVRLSHVLLTFTPYHGERLSVIAKVVYCKEIGYYFQMGCEFCFSQEAPTL